MAKSEGIAVKMVDGRTVTFGKLQKMKKEHLTNAAGDTIGVRFNFVNGVSHAILLADIPGYAVLTGAASVCMGHGTSQKVGDESAELDSVEDMIEATVSMIERLTAGKWTAEKQGFAGQAILIEALMEVTKQGREAVRAVLKSLTPKERAALKFEASIKPVYERLEAEKSKGVDTSAVLAKFATPQQQ